jgi:hypothetical protein
MVAQVLNYRLSDGLVTGQLANKTLHFNVQKTGMGPRPGRYRLFAVNHRIYGLIAVMTPVDSAPRGSQPTFQYRSNPAFQYDSSPTFQYRSNPAFQYDSNPVFQYDSNPTFQYDSNPSFQYSNVIAPSGGAAFVLSANPLVGQNSLALGTQANEVLTALRTAGGATLIVG